MYCGDEFFCDEYETGSYVHFLLKHNKKDIFVPLHPFHVMLLFLSLEKGISYQRINC